MDVGSGVWTGSDGRLRALYNIYPNLGAATGRSRIRGVEPAKPDDFSGRNVERMAIDADTPLGAGDGDAGGTGGDVSSPAGSGRVRGGEMCPIPPQAPSPTTPGECVASGHPCSMSPRKSSSC